MHFLPFWQHSEQDILPLVEALQSSPANQVVARAVAANAYTFSAAHFNEAGVYRYWQKVVDRYVQLYRGPADATAAAKALKWAEAVGRRASKHGEKVEAECWKNKGGTCWYVTWCHGASLGEGGASGVGDGGRVPLPGRWRCAGTVHAIMFTH